MVRPGVEANRREALHCLAWAASKSSSLHWHCLLEASLPPPSVPLCPPWGFHLCLCRALSPLCDLCTIRYQSLIWVTVIYQGAQGRALCGLSPYPQGPTLSLVVVGTQVQGDSNSPSTVLTTLCALPLSLPLRPSTQVEIYPVGEGKEKCSKWHGPCAGSWGCSGQQDGHRLCSLGALL